MGYKWFEGYLRGSFDYDFMNLVHMRRRIADLRWTTKPTEEQQRLMEGGTLPLMESSRYASLETTTWPTFRRWRLPDNIDKASGRPVSQSISEGPRGVELHNAMYTHCEAFNAIALLRVNKQISGEASEVLYGENTYVFHNNKEYRFDKGIEVSKAPSQSGCKPGSQSTRRNGQKDALRQMCKVLNKDLGLSRWRGLEKTDSLIRFLDKIGPANTSRLRRIKIQGSIHVREPWKSGQVPYHYMSHNLLELLPIHTAVLRNICPSLQRLEAHLDGKPIPRPTQTLEQSELHCADDIIRHVVEDLPNLQQLRLEGDSPVAWGDVVRWEQVVKDRHNRTLGEAAAREMKKKGLAIDLGEEVARRGRLSVRVTQSVPPYRYLSPRRWQYV